MIQMHHLGYFIVIREKNNLTFFEFVIIIKIKNKDFKVKSYKRKEVSENGYKRWSSRVQMGRHTER